MSYSRCGLYLKDFSLRIFCREGTIHGYHQCLRDRLIPDYKLKEGGELPLCQHGDVPTMRVSRCGKNAFRPCLACRRKDSCRYFRFIGQMKKLTARFINKVNATKPTFKREQDKPSCKDRDIDDN